MKRMTTCLSAALLTFCVSAAAALVFGQARNGQLQLSVDTGAYVTHSGCFEQSPEDLFIPDERGVTSDKLLERPPASKP